MKANQESQQLVLDMGALEAHLLLLCLPYLEADEDRIFDDFSFIEEVKEKFKKLSDVMEKHVGGLALMAWNKAGEMASSVSVSCRATDVLLLAVAVTIIRCTIENLEGRTELITISRARAHKTFHQKILNLCSEGKVLLLNGATDDIELRNLLTVMNEKYSSNKSYWAK